MIGFLIVLVNIGLYAIITSQPWSFLLGRVIGIYYQGSKGHPILNTMIMVSISVLVSYRLRKMMLKFQMRLSRKAAEIKINPQD